jgi:hypothetical protein
MSKTDQRRVDNWRIAQFLGWRRLPEAVEIRYVWKGGSQEGGVAVLGRPDGTPALEDWIPDYTGDLNAMREAEMALDIDEQYLYGEALAKECRREENELSGESCDHEFPFNGWGHFSLATMDAGIRGQVFIKLFAGGDEEKSDSREG